MPSKVTRPVARAACGRSRITVSAVIDLPEPDSPTSPITSPGATAELDVLQDRRVADRQRQVLDLEQAHRCRRDFGSRMSAMPSPSRFRPSTVMTIAMPGKIAIQGATDHAGLRVEQHAAPARHRRLRAEPDIGQPGFGQDAERELDGALHQQQRGDVGQHVLDR